MTLLRWGAVLAAGAALGVVWWLAAGRRTADRRPAFGLVATVCGTLPWIWMILTPSPAPRRVQLDPVEGLAGVLHGGFGTAAVQLVGNLLVFAAFGAFAPLRWPRLTLWRVLALAALGSATVEVLQYALDLGRVSATDDVLVNTLGAGLAYGAGRWLLPPPRAAGSARFDVEPFVGDEGGEPVLGQG
ncbi:VanZ family protein [Dactylosporangium aurantiacum]|uniref:VanZ family protein n=1 Tax=Dactylosporangium aurantiacum TaxID=35754 RepID=A0A9Q9IIT2_9ACTN|nr:VanZ family protein [Dactylosporangium aurantiacum]MDG6102226.1 VanZ family protein [Dactylosporangium aurantiacum]UWZ53460.1 VanZ family protein [Dactylosporangium aurantiacum]